VRPGEVATGLENKRQEVTATMLLIECSWFL
jgi:hypothetical protein